MTKFQIIHSSGVRMIGKGITPRTLRQGISPITITNWVFGTSVLEYPLGRLRPIPTLIYDIVILAVYGMMVQLSIDQVLSFHPQNAVGLGLNLYKVLVLGDISMGLGMIILGWIRRKAHNESISRLAAVDDSLTSIGVPKDYRKTFISQVYQLLVLAAVMVAMSIIDATMFFRTVLKGAFSMSLTITFQYPVVVICIVDLTFISYVWSLGERFQSLNNILDGLARPKLRLNRIQPLFRKPMRIATLSKETTDYVNDSKVNLRFVQESRRIHLELCDIANQINAAYGIHVLLSLAISSILILGLLFTIYVSVSDVLVLDAILESVSMICWFILYSVKILMFCDACGNTSAHAQKTGEIIHGLYEPTTDEELREEIQEFSLQLLQNPLSFTACGFFTLDYTFVQGVIGSVTTYLVILIQMNSIKPSNKDLKQLRNHT